MHLIYHIDQDNTVFFISDGSFLLRVCRFYDRFFFFFFFDNLIVSGREI